RDPADRARAAPGGARGPRVGERLDRADAPAQSAGRRAHHPRSRGQPPSALPGGEARHLPSGSGGAHERAAPLAGAALPDRPAPPGGEGPADRERRWRGLRPRRAGGYDRRRGDARAGDARGRVVAHRFGARERHYRHPGGAGVNIPLKTKILLADDHQMVRGGLRVVLDAEPDIEVVAEAGDGAEALRIGIEEDIDLAVLDVSMPKLTGLQVARELHRHKPELRILMLSMHENEQYFFEALKAGASGYVLKS